MTKNSFGLLFALTAMMLVTQQVKADLVYSVGFSGPLIVSPGQNFNATIYLQEIVTGGSSTILGDPGLGIVQGNFRLTRTAGSSIDITGVTLNPGFDNGGGSGTSSFSASSASGTQFTVGALSGTETTLGSGIYRLTLATISMTATTLGDTTFTSQDFDAGLQDLVLFDGSALGLNLDPIIPDPTINGGIGGGGFGGITIQSAPEPTTMGTLGAFGAIGAAVSYYRRRKQKQATPTTAA